MVKLEAGSSPAPAAVPNGASQSSPAPSPAAAKEESDTKPAAAATAAPYMYSTKVHFCSDHCSEHHHSNTTLTHPDVRPLFQTLCRVAQSPCHRYSCIPVNACQIVRTVDYACRRRQRMPSRSCWRRCKCPQSGPGNRPCALSSATPGAPPSPEAIPKNSGTSREDLLSCLLHLYPLCTPQIFSPKVLSQLRASPDASCVQHHHWSNHASV